MSKVRVLVGTRKGAFILTSDGKRNNWEVSGPHFSGWELYHLKGSPADPNRIYASQTSGWFGQQIQRSDDGGKTWHQPGTPAGQEPPPGPPQAASNTAAPSWAASIAAPSSSSLDGSLIAVLLPARTFAIPTDLPERPAASAVPLARIGRNTMGG